MRPILAAAVATAGALIAAGPAAAAPGDRVDSFRPIATFEVPDGGVAEIVATTPSGRQLVYSDSGGGAIGVVDVANPAAPRQTARIAVPGEPTAVAVSGDGRRAVVAVRTATLQVGVPPAVTPGLLVVIDPRTGGRHLPDRAGRRARLGGAGPHRRARRGRGGHRERADRGRRRRQPHRRRGARRPP